jgi:hypothetical protein
MIELNVNKEQSGRTLISNIDLESHSGSVPEEYDESTAGGKQSKP